MPPSVRTLRYTQRELQVGGGLNLVAPATTLADNELVQCTNFYIDESGVLRKRPGLLKDIATAAVAGATSVVGVDWLTGSYIVPVNGPGAVLYTSGSAIPLTSWPGGSPGGYSLFWGLYVNGVNYLGFSGAPGQIRVLTGAAVGAAIANSPESTTSVWHKSRIFTNVVGAPGRIAFSNPSAAGTWTASDTIDIGVNDKETISCFASIGDLLYIFKQDSIWVLYVQGDSPANWVYRQVTNNLGSIATGQYSVLVDKNLMYIIDKTGVYLSNGASFNNISESIWDPVIKAQISTASRIMKWGNYLVLNVNLTAMNRTFVYNLEKKAWSEWTFFNSAVQLDSIFAMPPTGIVNLAGPLVAFATVSGTKGIYLMDEAYALQYPIYAGFGWSPLTDGFTVAPVAGTTVISTFKTKEFSSFIDWYWRIKWMSLEYLAYASPQFNMYGDGSIQAGYNPGFQSSFRKAYKIPGAGRCRVFQLRCIHNQTTPFEFYRGEYHFGLKTHISQSGTP